MHLENIISHCDSPLWRILVASVETYLQKQKVKTDEREMCTGRLKSQVTRMNKVKLFCYQAEVIATCILKIVSTFK